MSEESQSKDKGDSRADTGAIIVMLVTLILMALHFISGFTFDF